MEKSPDLKNDFSIVAYNSRAEEI